MHKDEMGNMITQNFGATLSNFLDQYLLECNMIDERKPVCPDVEDVLPALLNSSLPDSMREFNSFPIATFAWMMYMGMGVTKFWDVEWEIYSKVDDLYTYLRDKRGYDNLDDYVCDDVLGLNIYEKSNLQKIVTACADGAFDVLMHSKIENGTREAFDCFLICLRLMFQYGMYIQLKSLGYHMTKTILG